MTETHVLGLQDAVFLAHAYVHAIAAELNIRVVSIKGWTADYYELRPARVSADADLLVDPVNFERLVDSLRRVGWRERELPQGVERWPQHSTTLIMDGWPCDLDLHHSFPGFLADPSEVFEVLWDESATETIAGRRVRMPSFNSAVLIAGLHALRGTARQSRHVDELRELNSRFGRSLNADSRAQLMRLAERTGCIEALDGALTPLGIPRVAPSDSGSPVRDASLKEWRERVASGSSATYYWLRDLRQLPWRRRPAQAIRLIWPSREFLTLANPSLRNSNESLVRYRVKRLRHGAQELARIAAARWIERRR